MVGSAKLLMSSVQIEATASYDTGVSANSLVLMAGQAGWHVDRQRGRND